MIPNEMKVSNLQKNIARLDNRCRKCIVKRGAFACEAECREGVTANREILSRQMEVVRR